MAQLRQLILAPALSKVAAEHAASADFHKLAEAERFDALHDYLKRYKAKSLQKRAQSRYRSKRVDIVGWLSESRDDRQKAKKVAIEITNVEAKPFSEWLSSRMDRCTRSTRVEERNQRRLNRKRKGPRTANRGSLSRHL